MKTALHLSATPAAPPLPLRHGLDRITHIGTMQACDKGQFFSMSYEGDGLSISNCPEYWVRIAKLGGHPWWHGDVSGLRLVDAYGAVESHGLAIDQWASNLGLIEHRDVWEVDALDEDGEVYGCFQYPSRDRAIEEHIEEIELDPLALRMAPGLPVASIQLLRQLNPQGGPAWPFISGSLAVEYALISYAQAHGYDGLWFDDAPDPTALSAPRGVIFPKSVCKVDFVLGQAPVARPRYRA